MLSKTKIHKNVIRCFEISTSDLIDLRKWKVNEAEEWK